MVEGQAPGSANTGPYCKARARLPIGLARLRLRPTSREGLRLITEVIYTSVIAVCLDGEVDLKSERQPEPLP